MNYSTLYGKQIVSVKDGIRVGTVCDVTFDACSYQLLTIYACTPLCGWKRFFPMLFQKDATEIQIEEILSLEGDVILVR